MMIKDETKFKKDIIAEYAEKEGITKVESEKRIEDILGIVKENLVEGYTVKLSGFFNFFVKKLKAKKGVNPRNPEEEIVIPATRTINAKMTKPLKDSIQGNK